MKSFFKTILFLILCGTLSTTLFAEDKKQNIPIGQWFSSSEKPAPKGSEIEFCLKYIKYGIEKDAKKLESMMSKYLKKQIKKSWRMTMDEFIEEEFDKGLNIKEYKYMIRRKSVSRTKIEFILNKSNKRKQNFGFIVTKKAGKYYIDLD